MPIALSYCLHIYPNYIKYTNIFSTEFHSNYVDLISMMINDDCLNFKKKKKIPKYTTVSGGLNFE